MNGSSSSSVVVFPSGTKPTFSKHFFIVSALILSQACFPHCMAISKLTDLTISLAVFFPSILLHWRSATIFVWFLLSTAWWFQHQGVGCVMWCFSAGKRSWCLRNGQQVNWGDKEHCRETRQCDGLHASCICLALKESLQIFPISSMLSYWQNNHTCSDVHCPLMT